MMIAKRSLKYISNNRTILTREEDFAYVLPSEQLRSLISNFTITFPNQSTMSDNYRIMPHGSATLVLFEYNAEFHSFLFGPTTKPQKVGDIANKCNAIFIVEFQPGGFSTFTKINQKELKDKIVPFGWIDNSLDNAMRCIFSKASSADGLLHEFEKVFIKSIRFPYPKELAGAVSVIIEKEGVITSADISNETFYSSRHLNRLFNIHLGMGTKAFSRLVRINKAIRLLNDRTYTMDNICVRLGYYDVSHFIKDFKVICGITPQQYKSNMSDFYSEIAKY